MSLAFYLNNAHFAIELLGAVVFLAAAWLTLDSYKIRKDFSTLIRVIGFAFCAIAQVLFAANVGNDLLSYVAYILYVLGLLGVASSFFKRNNLQVQAVVVIPSFSMFQGYLHGAVAVLMAMIAFASFRQYKKEFNKTWIPFSIGFFLCGLGAICGAFVFGNQASPMFIAENIFSLVGFAFLADWVWQFLQLRVRESLILIFISAALLLSTVVTLAFSTILIGQVAAQTDANLLIDVKVLDLQIRGLKEQSVAKTALIAHDPALNTAITKNDFPALETIAEQMMETYGLGFVTITDKDGSVLVRAHALSRRGDSLLGERAFEEAFRGNTFVTIEESPVEKLSIRAGAPILEKGKPIGVVIAGYPLDNALVDSVKRLTGLDMLIYSGTSATAASAFASDGRTRLTGVSVTDPNVRGPVMTEGKSVNVRAEFFGRGYRASYLPLKNGDEKVIGMLSAAKPEQDILDVENSTNRLTLVTVVLIMLLLAWPIYLFTKRLSSEGM